MIALHNRPISSLCLVTALLSLSFVFSCKTNPPDAREQLVRSLQGADVNGYLFATKEEEDRVTTSLTNPALANPVKLDSNNSLVIGYASVKDKKANSTTTLKAEVVKIDNALRLHVTDIDGHKLVVDEIFTPRVCPGEPVFGTLSECFDDFNCKVRPELQCEANRTCKSLLFDVDCCLKDGTRIEALMIIRPTARRCLFVFPFDVDTLVLAR